MSEALLAAVGVGRRYDGRAVLRGVSVGVERGQVLAVLGPNGAGKSTLFRILLLLEAPDDGAVTLEGRPVHASATGARQRLAGVFQRPWLFRGSVRANLTYGLRTRGLSHESALRAAADVIDALGLGSLLDAPVDTLSGGEAQRVALARALALRPDVLLLDEPTANLDVTAQRRFREDLEHLVRAHARAAIIVTHDAAEAFALADRVAVLEAGAITQTGAPAELVAAPATPFVAAFTGAELLLDGTAADTGVDGVVTVHLAAGGVLQAVAAPGHPPPHRDGAIHVAYRPEDVTLGPAGATADTSAVNRLSVVVRSVVPAGGLVRVRLEGAAPLTALLTRGSAEALELAPGRAVTAYLKATALRAFPA